MNKQENDSVRLDKWLWAARFFKTRTLAKQAIEGGKVHYDGAKVKPGREVRLGKLLVIRQGWSEKTVVVKGLNSQRRSATEAALLYEETEESINAREAEAKRRSLLKSHMQEQPGRPNKKDRRQIRAFKDKNIE